MTTTQQLLQQAAQTVIALQRCSESLVQDILNDTASALLEHMADILEANREDLSRMDISNPKYDRLKLTESRIESIAQDMRNVSTLPSPLGKIYSEVTRPNGMTIKKVSVPFGVIGVIYEARPNVTCDVFSLCLKSGNVCILKGGSDADCSNRALVKIIHQIVEKYGVPPTVCTLRPPDRQATTELLHAVGLVDLLIPRGSSALIQYVRENTRIPVIETGAGICHTYFDLAGDKLKGQAIITNAKTRRVSVCNALDCLIIHKERLADLPELCTLLAQHQVIIYADEPAFKALQGKYPAHLLRPATADSYGTEFLDYKMSIRTVASIEEALQHIAQYSSKHSECIISEDQQAIATFKSRLTQHAYTPTYLRRLRMEHNSALVLKSESVLKKCMHAVRWLYPNLQPINTS